MKFNHNFKPDICEDRFYICKCGGNTARIDFVNKACIRVAVYNDGYTMLPTFNINPTNTQTVFGRDRLDTAGFDCISPKTVTEDGKTVFLLNDSVKIKLDLKNFILSYYNDDKLLFSDRAPLAYNLENEFGHGVYHYVSRADNEHIYGLGDKGGEFDKAGRAFRIETSDCMGYDAKSSDPLYKHIPFYICENEIGSYGIFYDTCDTSYIDLGKEINNYYEPYKYFKSEDNCLVYYVFFGTKPEILKQFANLCGKCAFPPKWSFDYCASTMAYTDAPKSEEKMNDFLKKVKELDLACSGFYLSSGYTSIGEGRYVFNWNYDKFPSPKSFISNFAQNKIEIIPNIKPAFLLDHPMYNELAENGLFIKNPDGTPFVTRFWDGNGSYLDFTNKSAFDFWKKQVTEKLLDNGITATWNDNNEFDIKDSDAAAVGFNGKSVKASRIRPVLTQLMLEASYQAQTKKYPDLRPFLSTRSGGIATRRLAQTWSGDNRSEFADLRYCHNIGLTMSMSGLYFYGHDLGGFSGDMPSRELLLRWLQHGVFEPRMTIHSWNADGSATMPWSYPDIIPSIKELFKQRKMLKPYLYNCAYNAVQNNVPINAPLLLYYNDKELKSENNSMLLGRDILVSFVFDEGEQTVKTYLPSNDDWYLGDRLFTGGQVVEQTIPAKSAIPYFVKAASVVPTDDGSGGFDSEERLVFTVYPIANGSFKAEYFDDDGLTFEYKKNNCVKLTFTVECKTDKITVAYKNNGNIKITPRIKLCSADKRMLEIKEAY